MNRRKEVLEAFIRYDVLSPSIFDELRGFPVDWEGPPVATVTRRSLDSVLGRFLAGELDAAGLQAWGEQLECREDVGFEAGHESKLKNVVFRIATPEINEPLSSDSIQTMRTELNETLG